MLKGILLPLNIKSIPTKVFVLYITNVHKLGMLPAISMEKIIFYI